MIDFVRAGMRLAEMKRNQWLDGREIGEIADARLERVIEHARKRVPYYSEGLKGVGKVRSAEDLCSVPLTQKSDIKRSPESFVSREFKPEDLHFLYTSGSTGVPLKLYYSRTDSIHGFALKYHALTEFGFAPSRLVFSMMVARMPRHPLDRILYRSANISPFIPEEEKLRRIALERPQIVISYPSTFLSMAGAAREKAHFEIAVTASEVLSANTRGKIEGAFSCKVRNYYGTNECWSIGWECEKGRMHINSDSVIVEILDGRGRPARRGNVVITSLWRYSMPIIRYNLGDVASLEGRCPCGRGLAVISPIEGRSSSMVRTIDGRQVPWIYFQQKLKGIPGLLQFQGIQETERELVVKIVPERGGEAVAGLVRKGALACMPQDMKLRVETVKSIPRSDAGKTMAFVSKLR